jgi:RimJ/RimL family protein N-acetyltransferase
MCDEPTLQTDRLTLRAAELADFEPIVEIWAHPDVVRYIGGRAFTRHESWMRLIRNPGLWQMLGYGYWTLVETASNKFVGQCGVADFKREMSLDISGIPEAGWVLHPDFHGRGYAFEAMSAVVRWTDENLSAPQTCAIIDPGNAVSIHLANKLGYKNPQSAMLGDSNVEVYFRDRR